MDKTRFLSFLEIFDGEMTAQKLHRDVTATAYSAFVSIRRFRKNGIFVGTGGENSKKLSTGSSQFKMLMRVESSRHKKKFLNCDQRCHAVVPT
jgi:hypothetical protein